MASSLRTGRDALPGGYDRFSERSRSRGDIYGEQRGKEYGRGIISDAKSSNTRGETRKEEPESEMHGKGQGGGGYGGDRGSGGGGGGFRDRGNESRGEGGYRDRGGQRDRGGERGYGGGGGGFSGGAKVSTVSEGQTSNMLSNHFRF